MKIGLNGLCDEATACGALERRAGAVLRAAVVVVVLVVVVLLLCCRRVRLVCGS